MARRKFIIANWKMNGSLELVQTMSQTLRDKIKLNHPPCQVVLCCPDPYFSELQKALQGSLIQIGAQHIHHKESGAFTGEISVLMLKDLKIPYCIVGHSERRSHFAETDDMVHTKTQLLVQHDIHPVICIGETLEQRQAGIHEETVIMQMVKALQKIQHQDWPKVILAYEPVWAIGTGKTATPEQANEMHSVIRKQLHNLTAPEIADKVPILYGGSANGANAKELLSKPEIDGLLIGGASLKPQEFLSMVMAV